ncbi:MAG: hypothetical protein ACRDNP_13265 [Gaiellaceae bacterium]
MDRRHSFAAFIRSAVREPGFGCEERVRVAPDDLEALASELEDENLALDPACGVVLPTAIERPGGQPVSDASGIARRGA